MARYARGYIKQDSHDSLISDVVTDVTTNTTNIATNASSITTLTTALATCTQNIITASRSLGTDYQNTTGKTMFVVASIALSVTGAGQTAQATGYVEAGDTTPDTAVAVLQADYTSANVGIVQPMFFMVPASSYYKISNTSSGGGAAVKVYWVEWTIG